MTSLPDARRGRFRPLAWLAACFFGVYMLARLGTLGWRVRRSEWLTAGV